MKEGEIIKKSDEVEAAFGDYESQWRKTNKACVGTLAPNPIFPARLQYRRKSELEGDSLGTLFAVGFWILLGASVLAIHELIVVPLVRYVKVLILQ